MVILWGKILWGEQFKVMIHGENGIVFLERDGVGNSAAVILIVIKIGLQLILITDLNCVNKLLILLNPWSSGI
jgi:hypothetical protein